MDSIHEQQLSNVSRETKVIFHTSIIEWEIVPSFNMYMQACRGVDNFDKGFVFHKARRIRAMPPPEAPKKPREEEAYSIPSCSDLLIMWASFEGKLFFIKIF